jgi:hypothetical protein
MNQREILDILKKKKSEFDISEFVLFGSFASNNNERTKESIKESKEVVFELLLKPILKKEFMILL